MDIEKYVNYGYESLYIKQSILDSVTEVIKSTIVEYEIADIKIIDIEYHKYRKRFYYTIEGYSNTKKHLCIDGDIGILEIL